MIKLIYAAFLFMISSAVVLFSKKDPSTVCRQEITGQVKLMPHDGTTDMIIQAADNKIFHPVIRKEGIVLAEGTKVRVCYDLISNDADHSSTIAINDVVCLP
jgi:hypothetical protein